MHNLNRILAKLGLGDNEDDSIILSAEELELKRAKAFITERYELWWNAYKQRMNKWFAKHPNRKYFAPTLEETRAETVTDEWLYYFLQRIANRSPEQRYYDEKNPTYGWNHLSTVHSIEEPCNDKCRFWPEEGRIETIEVLEDYKEYQGWSEIYESWKLEQFDS